jgi:serine/threonine-protein kinase RsbW
MKICELQFISEPAQVRGMVRQLLSFIDAHAPECQIRNDLRLILSELLYNAVIHGNREDSRKHVQVEIRALADRIYVSIRDEGQGFNYRQALEEANSESALLSEHGRGMVLVCSLTENLSFNESGNQVSFEMRLR